MGRKEEGLVRLIFQNFNGIKVKITTAHDIFYIMAKKCVEITGMSETNLNLTERKQQEMRMSMKIRFGQGKWWQFQAKRMKKLPTKRDSGNGKRKNNREDNRTRV